MASCSPPPPSRCRYCDAEIYWADENGHRLPVDVVPHPEGTKILRLQGGKIVCRTTFVGEILGRGEVLRRAHRVVCRPPPSAPPPHRGRS